MEYITSKVLSGERAAEFLSCMIHGDTQIQRRCIDLTAKQVYVLEGLGSLDFGGSELEMGRKKKYPKVKRSKEDKYGWWNLSGGEYIVEYNEELDLPEDKTAILYPRPELLANEASHPTIVINSGEKLPSMCISVGPLG